MLAEVAEQTRTAVALADLAHAGIDAAVGVLVELGRSHHESLVPASLTSAGTELEKGRQHLAAASVALADLDARL